MKYDIPELRCAIYPKTIKFNNLSVRERASGVLGGRAPRIRLIKYATTISGCAAAAVLRGCGPLGTYRKFSIILCTTARARAR